MAMHWMDSHGLDLTPPSFKFETVSKHRDPYSRQITEALHIIKEGNMNSKSEFGINSVCRLEAALPEWKSEAAYKEGVKKRKCTKENWAAFVDMIKRVKSASINKSLKMHRII